MNTIPILCVEPGTIYANFPQADPWGETRNAYTCPRTTAAVCHPPCGQWGRFRKVARTNNAEKWLGPWCVSYVREFGGIIEHPAYSKLWEFCGLPRPGTKDQFGGFTVAMWQLEFGHRCRKASWFYVVGCTEKDLPKTPLSLAEAECVIATRKDRGRVKKLLPDKERSSTPKALAAWLIQAAEMIEAKKPNRKKPHNEQTE